MSRLNVLKFISERPCFFDLKGITYSPQDVPFRIKIGGKRVLNIRANPNNLAMDFWGVHNDQPMYLYNHAVPVEYDTEGVLTFDASKFLDDYGKGGCLCTNETYRKMKERPIQSNTIMTTPYGAARTHYSGADLPLPYVDVFFAPGTLTICGQPIRSISWEALDMKHPTKGSYARTWLEELLSKPHTLEKRDVMRLLRRMEFFCFNYFWILTDTGSYSFTTSWDEPNDIRLEHEYYHYYPSSGDSLDVMDLGLTLLKATTPAELEKSLARQYKKGLANPLEDECGDEDTVDF